MLKKIEKPRKGYFWRRTGNLILKSQKRKYISRKPENSNLELPNGAFSLFALGDSGQVDTRKNENKKYIKISCNLHVIVEDNL